MQTLLTTGMTKLIFRNLKATSIQQLTLSINSSRHRIMFLCIWYSDCICRNSIVDTILHHIEYFCPFGVDIGPVYDFILDWAGVKVFWPFVTIFHRGCVTKQTWNYKTNSAFASSACLHSHFYDLCIPSQVFLLRRILTLFSATIIIVGSVSTIKYLDEVHMDRVMVEEFTTQSFEKAPLIERLLNRGYWDI